MNRIIEFRVWDKLDEQMVPWEECEDTELLRDAFKGKDAVAMQFTGLQDKNNKEIYEGDIISVHMNEKDGLQKGNVVFREGCFVAQFHYIPWDEERSKNFEYRVSSVSKECEVVGNIYEKVN